jgi:hypothetical protein
VLVLLVMAALGVGSILTFSTLTTEPTDTGPEVVAQVAGDQFPVTVAGEKITATNALFKTDTTAQIVKDQCGENLQNLHGAALDSSNKLTNDVIVLQSSNGPVCIGLGTTWTIGPVEVKALSMNVVPPPDSQGRPFKDPGGNIIHFRELGIRAVSSTSNKVQTLFAVIFVAVGAGLLGVLVEQLMRRRPKGDEAQGARPDNSSSAAQ